MSEQILSNQWTCKCSTVNPLRKRCCIGCGRKMPDDFLKRIYEEEICIQNIFFRRLKREKEISRCEKVGRVLTKFQTGVIVLVIAVLVACNGVRFYYYPEVTSIFLNNYMDDRGERFVNEIPEFKQKFMGIKLVSGVISKVWTNVWDSVGDVKDGLSEDRNRNSLNKEKINHIKERISEVKNYVTGKSE